MPHAGLRQPGSAKPPRPRREEDSQPQDRRVASGITCRLLYAQFEHPEYIIIGSGIARSLEEYCTGSSLLLLGLAGFIGLIVFYFSWTRLGLALAYSAIAASIAGLAIGLPLGLALTIALPTASYNNRRSKLEARFIVYSMILSMLLAGQAKLSEAFQVLARDYRDDLKDFSIENDYISSSLRLGRGLEETLEDAALITPSPTLKTLYTSLARASRVGIPPLEVVREVTEMYLNNYNMMVEKTLTSLGGIFEMFVSTAILLPVIVGVMGLLYAFMPVGGISFEQLLFLTIFVLVPIVSVVVVIISDSLISRLRV